LSEESSPNRNKLLVGAIWGAVTIVAALIILVGFLYLRYESENQSDTVKRELKTLEHIEDVDELNPLPNIVQAELYYREGDEVRAEAEFKKALKKDPTEPRALVELGTIYVEAERYDEAVELLEEVIRLRQNSQYANVDIFLAEANYQMGILRATNGDCERASDHFERSAAINPLDADAKYQLGLCYQVLLRHDDAFTIFRDAIDLDPTFAEALFALGRSLESLGRPGEAAVAYNQAAAADPSLVGAAESLQRLGQEIE